MFSKAQRKIAEEREKILSERSKKLYNGWDIIGNANTRYITVDDIEYIVEPAIGYVIDDYDSGIGSIELSHHEYMGFNRVDSYRNPNKKNELDFRFAELQDVIELKVGDEIQSIILKSSNLRFTYLDVGHPIDYTIIIDTDLIETLNNVRIFINNNDNIQSINFSNVSNKVIQLLLQMICVEKEKAIITFEELSENNYNKKLLYK